MNCPDQFLAVCRFLEPLFGWLVVFSMVTFVLSLVLIPWVVGRLSPDCFLRLHLNDRVTPPPSLSLVILVILRHALGTILLMAGIAMLFLPGQGLLTIILGALLVSFPGKRKLIGSLISQPKIRKSLDWLRNKRHKPPFFWPEFPGDSDEK